MQIALTKKLADATGIKPGKVSPAADPLFSWTANWTRVWANRKAEDMLVLVNNATRFTVAVYEVKRKDLKNVPDMMLGAIKNTLLALNLNPEIVDEYMQTAGEVEFAVNRNRQYTAWVNRAGTDCAFYVGGKYNGVSKLFCDTAGAWINHRLIGYSNNPNDSFKPLDKMFDALANLTGKPVYLYRAFELTVTLDLAIYKAVRRLIVAADIKLGDLHEVLQSVFRWENCHLHDWKVFAGKSRNPAVRLVMSEEDLAYDEKAILEKDHKLSEYFPKYKYILYTYDMGDNWEHLIKLARVIDGHDAPSPYLLEAVGQTPPEDVGGVGGYIDFREIMLNPNHEDYSEIKQWAGYWRPELGEWESSPRLINSP
ncbi:MAG: plasmid pRiA4b ORF-3 family protein [Desulfarculales bacterium]|jgi:hypothetical protein|nr:plasmid pRiA4b ORF-3 family protein [Desulfarculales bacterium]